MNDTRNIELNAIGVLKGREIEARILAPVVEALGREFGPGGLQILRETIAGSRRIRAGNWDRSVRVIVCENSLRLTE